jgi:hypothetical protein
MATEEPDVGEPVLETEIINAPLDVCYASNVHNTNCKIHQACHVSRTIASANVVEFIFNRPILAL